MRLFETIKETVTVGQAAEYYGMKIRRNNMICCPFHNDHHPSMKLNATYYYCFGCGATGDVIQFVANLFRLSNYEAAKKNCCRFWYYTRQATGNSSAEKARVHGKQKQTERFTGMPENGM